LINIQRDIIGRILSGNPCWKGKGSWESPIEELEMEDVIGYRARVFRGEGIVNWTCDFDGIRF
jgi:hypothetical protein